MGEEHLNRQRGRAGVGTGGKIKMRLVVPCAYLQAHSIRVRVSHLQPELRSVYGCQHSCARTTQGRTPRGRVSVGLGLGLGLG